MSEAIKWDDPEAAKGRQITAEISECYCIITTGKGTTSASISGRELSIRRHGFADVDAAQAWCEANAPRVARLTADGVLAAAQAPAPGEWGVGPDGQVIRLSTAPEGAEAKR